MRDTIQLEIEAPATSAATVTVYDLAGRVVLRETCAWRREG
ncbi:MAG: hypothetical protein ACREOU_00065 [Candidatus Eiseniibacteriota bacterium]